MSRRQHQKNTLGPFLKNLRIASGLSHRQVANRFTEWGYKCTAARVARIEQQKGVIRDLDIAIFARIFPRNLSEMLDIALN